MRRVLERLLNKSDTPTPVSAAHAHTQRATLVQLCATFSHTTNSTIHNQQIRKQRYEIHVSLLPSDTNNDPNYWGSKWYRPAALPPLDREFNVPKSKRDEMQVGFHAYYT
jgi:hypothetical protein